MSKIKFTGTATQPQRNRKFCQFKKDQYCNIPDGLLSVGSLPYGIPAGTCHLLFASCHLLFAISRNLPPSDKSILFEMPIATCQLPVAVYDFQLLLKLISLREEQLITCQMPLVICYLLVAICKVPFANCHSIVAICYLPFASQLVQPDSSYIL